MAQKLGRTRQTALLLNSRPKNIHNVSRLGVVPIHGCEMTVLAHVQFVSEQGQSKLDNEESASDRGRVVEIIDCPEFTPAQNNQLWLHWVYASSDF